MQTQADIEKLKYPIGRFTPPSSFSTEEVKKSITALETFPWLLENAIAGLVSEQMHYRYRPESWNVAQIVHHLADSHANFHTRLRLTLTEELPTVKPYDENSWARLPDGNDHNIEPSVLMLKGVHARAVSLLKSLSENDFAREYFHPEQQKKFSLFWLTSLYAWHGAHHVAQIKTALEHKF